MGQRLAGEEQTYSIIESLQEVDLICHTLHLGLQFHFGHIGSIDILRERSVTVPSNLWAGPVLGPEEGATRACPLGAPTQGKRGPDRHILTGLDRCLAGWSGKYPTERSKRG